MARFTSTTNAPTATPPRKTRAYADAAIGYLPAKPRAVRTFTPAADDPLDALAAQLTGKSSAAAKASNLTAHGKPVGSIGVFGERRAPARRAAFRTPPR